MNPTYECCVLSPSVSWTWMHLKGKTKLKAWGWLLKKDQVSEDDKHGKQSETICPTCWFTSSVSDWYVLHQEPFNHADTKSKAQCICDLNVELNFKVNICALVSFYSMHHQRKPPCWVSLQTDNETELVIFFRPSQQLTVTVQREVQTSAAYCAKNYMTTPSKTCKTLCDTVRLIQAHGITLL